MLVGIIFWVCMYNCNCLSSGSLGCPASWGKVAQARQRQTPCAQLLLACLWDVPEHLVPAIAQIIIPVLLPHHLACITLAAEDAQLIIIWSCLQAKRRAELTSRRTAVFVVASAAVVAGLYLGYRYNAMNLVDSLDSTESARDNAAGPERSSTESGASHSRRDIGGYVRGLYRTWLH